MQIDMHRYNTVRNALANEGEESVLITVKPKTFALKMNQPPETLETAWLLLEDPRIKNGISPLETLQGFDINTITHDVTVFILLIYAVALKEGWITYSSIINKYYVNPDHLEAKQFVEDTHRFKIH